MLRRTGTHMSNTKGRLRRDRPIGLELARQGSGECPELPKPDASWIDLQIGVIAGGKKHRRDVVCNRVFDCALRGRVVLA